MEKELNIAAILKDTPKYTKLWSPLYGEVFFNRLVSEGGIRVLCKHLDGSLGNDEKSFWKNGKFTLGGEVCLFPSKAMQDWSKFAWKKGDVLCSNDGDSCIFLKWSGKDYTSFLGGYSTHKDYEIEKCQTSSWGKCTNKEDIDQYILAIEEIKGGKLNLETLAIEKPEQEFKDGDVVVLEEKDYYAKCILILKSLDKEEHTYYYYTFYNTDSELLKHNSYTRVVDKLRPATDSEKQQLFDALAKKGKAWDSDKKMLVDLPKKCEFKAMDWCLMRRYSCRWELCQYSFYDVGNYHCVGGAIFHDCIPYNDQTAHLLGTNDEWKGGSNE